MTNTVDFASDIAAILIEGSRTSLDLGSQGWLDHAVLIPIVDPEQPRTRRSGHARGKPKFTGFRRRTGAILDGDYIILRSDGVVALPARRFERTARVSAMTKLLVSIVEDDRFFRESMSRLMRSLSYVVECFPSADDFLASPRLAETACLIADVHMPGMTGIELHRHLIEAGHAIPTILVTAYPNDADRARALDHGVVCYMRKPVDEQHLVECLRSALTSG